MQSTVCLSEELRPAPSLSQLRGSTDRGRRDAAKPRGVERHPSQTAAPEAPHVAARTPERALRPRRPLVCKGAQLHDLEAHAASCHPRPLTRVCTSRDREEGFIPRIRSPDRPLCQPHVAVHQLDPRHTGGHAP